LSLPDISDNSNPFAEFEVAGNPNTFFFDITGIWEAGSATCIDDFTGEESTIENFNLRFIIDNENNTIQLYLEDSDLDNTVFELLSESGTYTFSDDSLSFDWTGQWVTACSDLSTITANIEFSFTGELFEGNFVGNYTYTQTLIETTGGCDAIIFNKTCTGYELSKV
jgi:hypothetical protein